MGKALDLTGLRFGLWTVVGIDTLAKTRSWVCRCECGNEQTIKAGRLRRGDAHSCGCANGRPGNQATDLSGNAFGRWTVIEFAGKNQHGQYEWKSRCSCGVVRDVVGTTLRSGASRSCGCLRVDTVTTHGATREVVRSPEYTVWHNMLARCYDDNLPGFRHYGERGITVCDRWRHSFENFIADMGERPDATYSIDRYPDNDGNYESSNCRWATQTEQMRNASINRMIEHDGETLPLAEWAERAKLPYDVVRGRLRKGWDLAKAMAVPHANRRRDPSFRFNLAVTA